MRRVKPFLALLHKEWRDVRALSIVCALLVPIALIAMNEGFLDWRGDVGAWFVVATTVLYVVVIAADLVAADIASGRARSYAALPVSDATLWSSKLVFLTLAATLFFGWSFAVTTGLYATLAPADAEIMLWTELNGSTWPMPWLGLGIGAAAVVVFWSTILERGMAVVGAALVTSAAIGGLVPLLAWYDRELLPSEDALKAAALALPCVFLVGSLAGFVRGPHHASTLLRRLLVAAAVPLCVLVPTGAVSATVLLDRLDVELGDPEVRFAAGHVSPDGRYLALLGAKSHRHARVRTWIVDLEEGDVVALPQRGLEVDWEEPWNADGSYVAWTVKDHNHELRREYDPETGAILRTRSADQVNAARPYPFVRWATVRRDGDERVVTMAGVDGELRLPASARPRFSKVPGYVLRSSTDGVFLHDVRAGTTTRLHEGGEGPNARVHGWFSPRGEYVQIWGGGKQTVFATRTAEPTPVGDDGHVAWSGGGASDHYAWLFSGSVSTTLVDLRTGWTCEMSVDPNDPRSWDSVRVLGKDRILRIARDGTVTVLDATGHEVRTAFDPHAAD